MRGKFIFTITELLFGKHLHKMATEIRDRRESEAGESTAARFARGNVAIQHGRINDKPLYN